MSVYSTLNILQRGIFQFAFSCSILILYIFSAVMAVEWITHLHFINIINTLLVQNKISEHVFLQIKTSIESDSSLTTLGIIFISVLLLLCGYVILKLSTRLNIVRSVSLPTAVEFSSALRRLGILELKEQIEFARRHGFPIFIAAKSILHEEQENVKAKLYYLACTPLHSKGLFTRSIGQRRLCLDAEDYERLARESKQHLSLETSIVVAEKNEEIKSLRTALASSNREAAQLAKERDELRNKLRIQPAQQDARVDRLRMERLLWAAWIPVMERMIRDAPGEKHYTTAEIVSAFTAEWKRRDELRAHMQQLTGSEEANPSENLIKAVKAEFKAAGKLSSGGRPKKNPCGQ